jgi:hypothetical protein
LAVATETVPIRNIPAMITAPIFVFIVPASFGFLIVPEDIASRMPPGF